MFSQFCSDKSFYSNSSFNSFRPTQPKFDLEASLNTLRRIGLFGEVSVSSPANYNSLSNSGRNKIDFEWPTKADAEDLPTDHPIKLVGFKFKEDAKVAAICAL